MDQNIDPVTELYLRKLEEKPPLSKHVEEGLLKSLKGGTQPEPHGESPKKSKQDLQKNSQTQQEKSHLWKHSVHHHTKLAPTSDPVDQPQISTVGLLPEGESQNIEDDNKTASLIWSGPDQERVIAVSEAPSSVPQSVHEFFRNGSK